MASETVERAAEALWADLAHIDLDGPNEQRVSQSHKIMERHLAAFEAAHASPAAEQALALVWEATLALTTRLDFIGDDCLQLKINAVRALDRAAAIAALPDDPDSATGCADDQTYADVSASALRAAVEAALPDAAGVKQSLTTDRPDVSTDAGEVGDWTGGRAWPEQLEAVAAYWAEWEEDRAGTGAYTPEELAKDAGEFATGLADYLAAHTPQPEGERA